MPDNSEVLVNALRYIRSKLPEAVPQAQFAHDNPNTPMGVWIEMVERELIYDNVFDDRDGYFTTPKGDLMIRNADVAA